ncbi:cmgc protein kinase [Ophiostoma piceae UAMH 11346]|uniref:Cmgc protein kinase n=1 Tax=Ophiostoma piceae (strain UAMH 11346) TaxID=1262450 RepID=S3C7Y6_OPHP1|nr:cmgc protein kinase [Ophiostoma piceae UAMH 11346]
MYLLNVDTLRLEEYLSEPPRYAILSHTWYAVHEELSFQDLISGKLDDAAKRRGRQKIDGCCKEAKRENYRYVWIDTCCIDKTNAVELGEAIISMFRWYQNAAICYVYLSDVPFEFDHTRPGSAFSSSRWFTRGWTLQELLAPSELRFYTKSWEQIALKQELAAAIEGITGIPQNVVRDSSNLDQETTVAQRLSWAARRETKREEDLAYCMVGLFGVHMSMIYGEGGRNAFIRLQEAILKITRDDSIFAWGLGTHHKTLPRLSSDAPISGGIWASSPADFLNCGQIVPRKRLCASNPSITAGRLDICLSITNCDGIDYGLLNCGPSSRFDQCVCVPLITNARFSADNSALAREFVKPHGHYATLLPIPQSLLSPRDIHIVADKTSKKEAGSTRTWLDIKFSRSGLTLVDRYPMNDWAGTSAKVPRMTDPDVPRSGTKWYLARFQPAEGTVNKLLLVVVEINVRNGAGYEQIDCHLMAISPSTPLAGVQFRLERMRKLAFGNLSMRLGTSTTSATINKEPNTGFVVDLVSTRDAIAPDLVDADVEMAHVDKKHEFVRKLSDLDGLLACSEQVKHELSEKNNEYNSVLSNLKIVESTMSALEVERLRLETESRLLRTQIQQAERSSSTLGRELTAVQKTIAQEVQAINDQEDRGIGSVQHWLEKAVAAAHYGEDVPPSHSVKSSGLSSRPRHSSQYSDSHTLQNAGWSDPGTGMPTGKAYWPIHFLVGDANNMGQASDTDPGQQEIVCPEIQGPIIRAIYHGRLSEATVMLAHAVSGHELSQQAKGWLLTRAVSIQNESMARVLIEQGSLMDVRDANQNTPLMHAVLNHDCAIACLLIAKGSYVNADRSWLSPFLMLPYAIENGWDDISLLLIENGSDLNDYPAARSTPLTAAVKKSNYTMAKLLLDRGASPNIADKDGNLPIAHAAFLNHLDMVQLLLSYRSVANAVHMQNGQCMASIDGLAALHGNTTMLLCLLHHITAYPQVKQTPEVVPMKSALVYAAENGHIDALELLFKGGCKVDAKSGDGRTPLICAAEKGHKAMAKHLLHKYKHDRLDRPAFNYAARTGNMQMAKLLVECGVRPEVKSFRDTPIKLAERHGHPDLAAYLRTVQTREKDGM